MKKRYLLGNPLRGGFEGEFESIDEAWSRLSSRFLLSFPSEDFDPISQEYTENPDGGRSVCMLVDEVNSYGIEDKVKCKTGVARMKERVPVSSEDYTYVMGCRFFLT